MCPVTGEIVGAELVAWILTVLYQVVCPCSKNVPILVYIARVALYLRNHGSQCEHVAGLFERHVATIHLAVGNGIGAQVVGCEGLSPAVCIAILKDTRHHTLL